MHDWSWVLWFMIFTALLASYLVWWVFNKVVK